MKFQQAISQYKRTWATGRCIKALLLLFCIFIIAVILYGFADAIWAINNATRSLLNMVIIGSAIIGSLWVIINAFRTPQSEISRIADSASEDSAKKIRAAYDLSQQEASSPLQAYLAEEAQAAAVQDIGKIPIKSKIPLKGIGLAALGSIIAIGLGLGIKTAHPAAYETISQRLINPDKDIPPYSPLKFQVTQESPNTLYGGENQVRVEITGGEIEEEVICRVRDKQTGNIEELRTFKETPTTFAKKFTNVLSNFEFSFATGKATSTWHDVEVILQPKFTNATIKVTPPQYTKKPAQEFPLEGNEISIINGSDVSLTITSNRPLSGGELQLITEADPQENNIKAIIDNNKDNQVSFNWKANNSASISCIIKDIRNTPSASSLEFNIITRADLAPVAELISPAKQVLATPSSSIPLKGIVEDDYEVDSVHLVRTLVGFRDRATQLSDNVSKVQYNFDKELSLAELGVLPKQTLEFYLEANDKNPNLLGVGLSDVVRVHIISDEDYATRLRNASNLRQFNLRYKVLTKAIREAITSLRDLKEENLKNQRAPFDNQLKTTTETHIKSYNLAQQIAQDFKAYSLEAKLTETAAEISDKLILNHGDLIEMKFELGLDSNEQSIDEMLERLGASLEKAEKIERDADKVKAFGEVAKQAAIFKKLLNQQKSISSRITNIAREIHQGVKRNAQSIKLLGNTQRKNKIQLLQFVKELKIAAEQLPVENDILQADIGIWLDTMEQLNIPDPMDATTLATEVGKSHEAAEQAFLAYSLMKQLHDMEENEFALLIRGELPESQKDKELAETMQELLDALHNQMNGDNQGQGGGRGGIGAGGEAGGGGSLMRNRNIPMFGPSRSQFNPGGSGGGKDGSIGKKGSNNNNAKISESNMLKPTDKKNEQASQSTRANVPSKYKEAVKRFYTDNAADSASK